MTRAFNPRPVSEEFMGHCVDRAHFLREFGMKQITPASVAYLLKYSDRDRRKRVSMKLPDERCKIIARILRKTGSEDGLWHAGEVERAYSLRRFADDALAALDPDPPQPQPPLPQFAQLAEFNRQQAAKLQTQDTPRRS